MNKPPRTPEQVAEERPSRAEMIVSGDVDPADSTTAADHVAPRRADLARLAAAMDGPIDTSDIPESTGPGRRVVRDAEGRLRHTPDAETEARRAMRPELRRAAAASWEHNRAGLGHLAGRTPCPLPHVPDAETEAVLRAADAGEGLTGYAGAGEMSGAMDIADDDDDAPADDDRDAPMTDRTRGASS